MIEKLFMTSVVPVIPVKSYYGQHGASFLLHPSSPSPELSHVATKGAFTPADDRRKAEHRAGSRFSSAKRTLDQQMESGGE